VFEKAQKKPAGRERIREREREGGRMKGRLTRSKASFRPLVDTDHSVLSVCRVQWYL
jgi:hypothetical protein